jgi:hypothetical protein
MDRLREAREKMRQKGKSGQILLIAAFIMASLLLSAQLYILDVRRSTGEVKMNSLDGFVLNVKQGSTHVVVGSLANISNGGSEDILDLNLREWASFLGTQYLHGKSVLKYTLQESLPYSSGIWLSWGASGIGISSAYVNFTHEVSGFREEIQQSYFTNITTSLVISSTNHMLNETAREVTIAIDVYNEAAPALAQQVTVYYGVSNDWALPDESNEFSLHSYGNGTYTASFVAVLPTVDEVSTHVIDQRGIFVLANVTSTEV